MASSHTEEYAAAIEAAALEHPDQHGETLLDAVAAWHRVGRPDRARELADRLVHFGTEFLLDRAGEIDVGFDVTVFVEMIDMLGRFTGAELATTEPAELMTFFREWAAR